MGWVLAVGSAVKRTISLPSDLAEEIDEISKTEGRSVSSIVQDALRLARTQRLKKEFSEIQGFWSEKAKESGILTQKDLDRLTGE